MSRLRALWAMLDRVGWVVAIVFVAVALIELHHQGQQITDGARNQLLNRATNVEAWCSGINGGRDYDRAFVARVTRGHVAYSLGDLPCEALIAKTIASANHGATVTEQAHPLTWKVVHP